MSSSKNQNETMNGLTKREADMAICLQPCPNTIVSCRGIGGENNALAVGFCCNCSNDPPMVMVGIAPPHYSYHMIKETGCFVLNLPEKANKELFNYCGSHSGKNEDKLAVIHANLAEGVKVNAPILSDCPVNIECSVVGSIRTGSHEMFIGKVEYVHVNMEYSDEKGRIKFSLIDLL